MSIVFKSSSLFSGASMYPVGFLTYITRVKADGGVIGDIDALFETYRELERLGIPLSSCKQLVGPAFGYQVTGSTITKMYNLANANDYSIIGTRSGTGATLSTLHGYKELIFADLAGSGQRALNTSFSATPFTFSKIFTGIQVRLDDANAQPTRTVSWAGVASGNTATFPRSPEPISVQSTLKFDQFSNGLATAPNGHYTGRCFLGASAFAKVAPSTSSQRRITNNRIALDDRLTITGAFDAGAGFNGTLYAYSGSNTAYDQDDGYGLGASMVLIDLTDAQWFGLRDKINAITG